MERKTYQTCLDPALHLLKRIIDNKLSRNSEQKRIYVELTSLKTVLWGLAYWEEMDFDCHKRLVYNSIVCKISQLAKQTEEDCRWLTEGLAREFTLNPDQTEQWGLIWDAIIYDLEQSSLLFIPHVKDMCTHFAGSPILRHGLYVKEFFEYAKETAYFVHLVQQNIRATHNSEFIGPAIKQNIAVLRGKMEEFGSYVEPVSLSITKVKLMYGLVSHARRWCNHIACLTHMYLVGDKDDRLIASMETLVVGLLHKNVPYDTSGVISSNLPRTMIHQLLGGHFDVLLENLVIPMKEDLQEGLAFLLSFILDPPEDDSLQNREMIYTQVSCVINEFPSLTYSNSVKFSDFLLKVDRVKTRAKELYVVTPYSPQLCAPSTNLIGFLKTVIRYLKEMQKQRVNLFPSLSHQKERLQKELVLLIPVVTNMSGLLQDEHVHKGIRDLWMSVINKIYNAYYFIKLCYPRASYLWYGMVGLPVVLDDIKSIKVEMNRLVGVEKGYTKKNLSHEETNTLLRRGTTSEIETNFTGFKEVERKIVDELIKGKKSLTIISISGSGGQGKSTLAKRIYNNSRVQYRFHKSIWCYVSKDCPVKEILVQLLSCGANDGDVHDLADRMRKSLKGRRYLIVMDDIWNLDGWAKLKSSFPDDNNGSRILFTSRNHDLGSLVNSNSISHSLPLFSDEESWELMRKRVFNLGNHDEELVEIGKRIASYCKGLPLAVALISGVLKRSEQHPDTWIKVADNLKAHLAEEGCGNVIELSYKYLPDHLKSCFLYFGVFPRGRNLRAKDLKLLWISEGFIVQDGGTQLSKMDLASEYLEELVSQNLVTVSERSSLGGIKECIIHDLLYDMCLERCKEDSFLTWVEIGDSSVGSNHEYDRDSKVYKYNYHHHRLRIGKSYLMKESILHPFIELNPMVMKGELPISTLHSLSWTSEFLWDYKKSSSWFLKSFKLLTVLNLEVGFDKFPEEVFSMIYLGYLKLYFIRDIIDVPLEICDMRMLETLIIDNPGVCTWLSDYFWNMKCLRQVKFDYSGSFCLKESDDENSGSLFRGASNIERLGIIRLNVDDSTTAELLQRCPHLTKLRCMIIRGHILKLLSMVGSLSAKLKSLTIDYYGSYPLKAPNPTVCNFTKIENLNKLSLRLTRLPWSVLSEIGKKLPNLYVLKLQQDACVGCSWKLEDGDFSKLIYLKLGDLDIEEIDVSSCEDTPFPLLEHLNLTNCRRLKEIPSVFGEINTLKTIKVSYCCKEVEDSAMRIWEQQKDFGNDSLQVRVI